MEGLFQSAVTIVLFFAILGSLVVLHELGHFITARLAGVRVLEFGIGFPPRAKVLRASGETLYTLNWLPIGGFVKLEGEDGDNNDDPRSFSRAPLGTRLVILAAGVVMNLLTALAIFFAIAWLASPKVGLVAPVVEPGSPAAEAGMRPGDAIVGVNGRAYQFLELDEVSITDDLRQHAGETVTLDVVRTDGARERLTATLRPRSEVSPTRGALGIQIAPGAPSFPIHFTGEYAQNDPLYALQKAGSETVRWFGLILSGLGDLASRFVADPTAAPPVQGPVGIATSIGEVFWGAGPIMTLYVAGILSANLALVNVLPFPPLDGGRMLVIVLKALFGRRISLRAERLTYFVGFAFLMAFLIWVTVFDVLRGGGTT
jgi:regulator of sigma E protease